MHAKKAETVINIIHAPEIPEEEEEVVHLLGTRHFIFLLFSLCYVCDLLFWTYIACFAFLQYLSVLKVMYFLHFKEFLTRFFLSERATSGQNLNQLMQQHNVFFTQISFFIQI